MLSSMPGGGQERDPHASIWGCSEGNGACLGWGTHLSEVGPHTAAPTRIPARKMDWTMGFRA